MIILLCGQPTSGKTTIAHALQARFYSLIGKSFPIVDGDDIRSIFGNTSFDKDGRLRNLTKISDIATFLNHQYEIVIISAVFPYDESRNYLTSMNEGAVRFIYLTYNGERGRETYHVKDFEPPTLCLKLDTSKMTVDECVDKIITY